jgi:L-seryl-tRNA(Ser) seleniumtransferase
LVARRLNDDWPGFLGPVINAPGIVLHTNLGRAPLSASALEAISALGGGYINLESNLDSGERGQRIVELRRLLCLLTSAEEALVVNNNAAAVLLTLVALANGKEAVVSRGELVQIGGGFRVPEIMTQSGVSLREVGTTNQTYARDYAGAINNNTAMLLKVHPSNFVQRGFIHEASTAELAELAHRNGLPLVYDLGSGALLDTADYGIRHEPTVQEALSDGADVVCFSGDKLLGGPQAGIIVGGARYIKPLLSHPLLRVVRLDRLSAVALEATLKHYLNNDAASEIPIWRMMALSAEDIARRAGPVVEALGRANIAADIIPGRSLVGGGSLPEETLATSLIAISSSGLEALSRRLRLSQPPLISRIESGRLLLDLRTVLPSQDGLIASLIIESWPEGPAAC